MKKNFKIFPALFLINANTGTGGLPIKKKAMERLNADDRDLDFRNGYPQTYCCHYRYNAERTMVTMHFNHSAVHCASGIDLPEAIFSKLNINICVGKQYTLMYVGVNN
jgi:hypothetical protein